MRVASWVFAPFLGAALVRADDYYGTPYDSWDTPYQTTSRQGNLLAGGTGGAGGTLSFRPNPAGVAMLISALSVR